MRKVVSSLGAAATVAGCLSLATPAFADYVGPANGQNGTGNQLPKASADAPSQSPVLSLVTLGGGTVLVAVGALALVDRRRKGYNR